MEKRTITIGLRDWQRLARLKIHLALVSYDAVLDCLFDEADKQRQAPEPERLQSS